MVVIHSCLTHAYEEYKLIDRKSKMNFTSSKLLAHCQLEELARAKGYRSRDLLTA